MRFRKKPVIIEAVQYAGQGNLVNRGQVPVWMWDALENGTMKFTNGQDPLIISTLEGEMTVSPNDWIIKGVQNEIYPCKPDIFDATYEPVSDLPEKA